MGVALLSARSERLVRGYQMTRQGYSVSPCPTALRHELAAGNVRPQYPRCLPSFDSSTCTLGLTFHGWAEPCRAVQRTTYSCMKPSVGIATDDELCPRAQVKNGWPSFQGRGAGAGHAAGPANCFEPRQATPSARDVRSDRSVHGCSGEIQADEAVFDEEGFYGRLRSVYSETVLKTQLDQLRKQGSYEAFKLGWHPKYDIARLYGGKCSVSNAQCVEVGT